LRWCERFPGVEEAAVFDVFTGEKIGDGNKSVGIRVKLQPLTEP